MTVKWNTNWDRSYKISVGTREYKEAKYTINASVVVPSKVLATDERVVPSNARVMGNLTSEGFNSRGFTFKMDCTQKVSEQASDSEQTQIDLYNLDEDLIKVINQKNCVILVEAGYGGYTELAYSGDVVKVSSFRSGADVVYRLFCKSGAAAMKNTKATLNYDENLSDEDIIIDMLGRLPGTALGTYGLSQLREEKKTGGRGFTGSLITNVDKLMAEKNLNWCAFNGKIVIIPYRLIGEDYSTFARKNYNLTADVIKKISDISDFEGKGTSDSKSSLKKLQINTYYLPIEVGQFVTIPYTHYIKEFAGTYQVKGKRTILASKGQAWDVVLEVDSLEQ